MVQDQLTCFFGRTIARSSRVQQRDTMGPVLCCLALRPELKGLREELGGEGVVAFAYMNDASLGLMGATANSMVKAFTLLRRELNELGLWSNSPRPWHYHHRAHPDGRGDFAPGKR